MNYPKAPTSPQPLQFYSTASYRCSYLPEQQARSLVAAPAHLINDAVYSKLVQQGFRRSGTFTYRPYCDQCRACQPLRCDALHFQPDRAQRRAKKRHGNLVVQDLPLHWNAEHYELYRRYQACRHPGAGMDEDDQSQYAQFLLASHVTSRLLEFREPDGTLKIVAVIDVLQDGLSAVYTFFDPDDSGSLGTYAVLWQLDYCRQQSLPWLYLGYWIEESRKMTYKTRFRPYQLLIKGRWEWLA